MSAIKDVIDLVTQLSKSVEDRKLATELLQIMSHLSTVQSENTELMSKNLETEKKIFNLEKKYEKEIDELKEKLSTKEFLDKCDFDETHGFFVSKEDGQNYCTSCLLKGIKSPLQKYGSSWDCKVKDCKQIYGSSQGMGAV